MAVQEESSQERGGGVGSNILDGAVLVLVSPLVVPALVLGLRPVAKTVIKGGLLLTGTIKQLATSTGEGWSTLVAEARDKARTTTAPGGEGGMAEQPGAADLPDAGGRDSPYVDAGRDPSQQPDTIDVQRLTGIGRKYAELLRAGGVDSVRALARRNPQNLHEKLTQVNDQHQIVSQAPSLELVTHWITEAQAEER
jgi:predicted flap endonuclease-1-like 5' DNA nuclease